jgi:hypothetical protein
MSVEQHAENTWRQVYNTRGLNCENDATTDATTHPLTAAASAESFRRFDLNLKNCWTEQKNEERKSHLDHFEVFIGFRSRFEFFSLAESLKVCQIPNGNRNCLDWRSRFIVWVRRGFGEVPLQRLMTTILVWIEFGSLGSNVARVQRFAADGCILLNQTRQKRWQAKAHSTNFGCRMQITCGTPKMKVSLNDPRNRGHIVNGFFVCFHHCGTPMTETNLATLN